MTPRKLHIAVALLRLAAYLPLVVLRGLGWLLGQFLWVSGSRTYKVALRNLALCLPDLSEAERRCIARRRMAELARTALEMSPVWFGSPERTLGLVRRVHRERLVGDALAAGRGVIIIAPHCGNWELLGLYLASHYPLHSMFLPHEDPDIEALIREVRGRTGASMAPANAAGVKALFKALKAGEAVGILPDQEPKQAGAEFAPLFGVPALTMTLVSTLAQRTGAAVVSARALRCPGGFELGFEAVDPAIGEPDLQRSLLALNQAVERCAMVDPAQYQWEYKRFKSQPDGRKLYRDL